MKFTKWLLIACMLLMIGVIGPALCRATPVQTNEQDTETDTNSDYMGDDYDYGDDDTENNESALPTSGSNAAKVPPFFEQTEFSLSANLGDNVLLNCDVRNFQINNVVMWYKNITLIATGQNSLNERIEALKNNSIVIRNVQADDADDYFCQVLPQNIRMHAALRVGGPLAILCDGHDVTDRSLTFKQGEQHKLECITHLATSPKIKWSFNGQRVDNEADGMLDGLIILENIDEEDVGIYQCLGDDGTADPPHGMITIDVHYSPKVSTHRHHVNTEQGASAELYCDYKASPIAINHWLKNGKILKFSDKYSIKNSMHKAHNRTTLMVKNVNAEDLGEYVCQVENSIGLNEMKVSLRYEPETPQFEDMEIDGKKVTLHWLVKSVQPLSEAVLDYKLGEFYTWSTVSMLHTERHAHDSGVWKITHQMELTPGVWHTRVKTRNTVGWSHFSPMHDFVMKPIDASEEEVSHEVPPGDLVMAGIGTSSKNIAAGQLLLAPKLFTLAALFSLLLQRGF